MINLEKQKEHFKNHKATFTDYGNIKILDFKKPNSSDYRVRFLFEQEYCKLHITGDLGELIASNYSNMTYERFGDFVNSVGYFEGKIDCHSRNINIYDEEKARKDILELLKKHEVENWEFDSIHYSKDEWIEDVLENFDTERGIGERGYNIFSKIFEDALEYTPDIGKENTGILDLYMLAFKLAMEQLEAQDETR